MSCEHEHHHGNGHNHGHTHSPPIPTYPSQNLRSKVDFLKLTALNAEQPQPELENVFKTVDNRSDTSKFISSDADCQLVLNIPLTGSVKLFSLILRSSNHDEGSCPRKIKFYKNKTDLEFNTIADTKPFYEIEHPYIPEGDQFVEHFLPRHLFTNITTVSLFFESNWSDDEDDLIKLFYIELRGEWTALTKDPVITLYEAAPNPADHVKLTESVVHSTF